MVMKILEDAIVTIPALTDACANNKDEWEDEKDVQIERMAEFIIYVIDCNLAGMDPSATAERAHEHGYRLVK